MLRVDKITLALLEENVTSILLGKLDEIPTLKMLFKTIDELKNNASILENSLNNLCQKEVCKTRNL